MYNRFYRLQRPLAHPPLFTAGLRTGRRHCPFEQLDLTVDLMLQRPLAHPPLFTAGLRTGRRHRPFEQLDLTVDLMLQRPLAHPPLFTVSFLAGRCDLIPHIPFAQPACATDTDIMLESNTKDRIFFIIKSTSIMIDIDKLHF